MKFFAHTVILVLAISYGYCKKSCKMPIKKLKDETPVFFRHGEFMEVFHGELEWASGDSTFVTCAESKFKNIAGNAAYIKCMQDKTFTVNGRNMSIDNLVCSIKFRGSVKKGAACGPSSVGEWHNFGFEGEKGFKTYFKTCYDMTKFSAIYSEHTLDGDLLNYVDPVDRNTAFNDGLIPPQVNIKTLYTQAHSEGQLRNTLGPKQQQNIKAITYLARGHLTPNKDATMPYFMRSTFFYENVVPQWQSINSGNWIRIENAARKKANALGRKLQIFTGVHKVLKLPDDNNVEREIYLSNINNRNILEVPMWMWKVIKDPRANEAIAFVTYNNPLRPPTAQEMLCSDVCASFGWNDNEFINHRKGYTYCCTVDKLKSIVPKDADALRALHK